MHRSSRPIRFYGSLIVALVVQMLLPLGSVGIGAGVEAFSPDLVPYGGQRVSPLPAWFAPPPRPSQQGSTPTLSKSASVATAIHGDTFQYTFVFTVPPGFALTTLEDILPSYPPLAFIANTHTGPTPLTPGTPDVGTITPTLSSGNRWATWVLSPTIVNNSSQDYVYQITIYAWVSGQGWGTAANNASLSWTTGGPATASTSVQVQHPDIERQVIGVSPYETASNPSPPDRYLDGLRAGDVVTFYQIVTNTTTNYGSDVSPAYDLSLRFQLPDWLAFGGMVSSHAAPITSTGGSGLNRYTLLEWRATSLSGGNESALNQLDPGGSLTIVFTATVKDNVAAGRDNNAQLDLSYYDRSGGTSHSLTGLQLTLRSAAPTLQKLETDLAPVGATRVNDYITYTLVITTPGPGVTLYSPDPPTTTIWVRDTLPDGLHYVTGLYTPAGWTGPVTSPSGGSTLIEWRWADGDITQTAVYTFQFLAQDAGLYANGTPIPRAQSLSNRFDLYWYTHDAQQLSSLASVAVNHVRPDIQPTKSASPASLSGGGEQVVWTISNLSNRTPYGETAYNIVISDSLPPGFTLVVASPPGYTTATLGGRTVITWGPYISLTAGSSLTDHVITSTAPAILPAGQGYLNEVSVFYTNTLPYTNTASRSVAAPAPVLQKSVSPAGDVRVGEHLYYTLTVEIAPGAVAYWPRYQDTLPSGIHYVTGTLAITNTSLISPLLVEASGGRQQLTWYVNTLSNPASSPLWVTATFQARVTATDTNGVELYVTTSDLQGGPNVGNRFNLAWFYTDTAGTSNYDDNLNSSYTFNYLIQPYLVDPSFPVTKVLVAPPTTTLVSGGTLITYALTVYNTGRASAYDVVLSDTLPWGLEFVTYTATMVNPYGGQVYTPTFSVEPAVGVTGTLVWQVDEVPGNDGNNAARPTHLTLTYTVRARTDVGAGALLTNGVRLMDYTSMPGNVPFERHYAALSSYSALTGTGQLHTTDALQVVTSSLTKTASLAQAPLGSTFVYTLTVPDPAINATFYQAVITDVVPDAFQITAVDAPGGNIAQTGNTLVITYAALSGTPPTAIHITVTVWPTATYGTYLNGVTMTWQTEPAGGLRHQTTFSGAPVTIIAPNVALSKGGDAAALPDQPVRYTIVYTNTGLATANGVRITDTLPPGVTLLGWSASPSLTLLSSDPLVWDVGNLAMGASGTIWITGRVPLTQPLGSQITNTAVIATGSAGDNPVDNQGTATTSIGAAVLTLVKKDTPDPVYSGGRLTYTLRVTNEGNLTAVGLIVTDRVPLSTTLLTAGGAATQTGGISAGSLITWDVGDLLVGDSSTLFMVVQVGNGVVTGTVLVNDRYGVQAGQTVTRPAPPPVTTTVYGRPVLLLTKEAAPSPVEPEQTLRYTLRYTNAGTEDALQVRITDVFPADLFLQGWSAGPALTQVSTNPLAWDVGGLPVGAGGTIWITGYVPSTIGVPSLINQAAIVGQGLDPVSVTLETLIGGPKYAYLPLIVKGFEALPNLIVASIAVSPTTPVAGQATVISVTIRNVGNVSTRDPFWVDLYVDPSHAPQPGELWNDVSSYGKAWLVYDALAPGESLVLTTLDPDDPQNPDARYSNWPGWFVTPGDHLLYARVDSYEGPEGWIPELDEGDNGYGPVTVTVTGTAVTATEAPAPLPRRRPGRGG